MATRQRVKEKQARVVRHLSGEGMADNLLESEIEMVTPGATWELVKDEAIKPNGFKDRIFTINGKDFDLRDDKNIRSELDSLLRAVEYDNSNA